MNELQNRTKRIKRWMIAALLCVCMIMTLIPVEYYGLSIADPGETAQAAQREILSFTELPAEISAQMVEPGTPLGELALPNTLTAICRLDPGALEPNISTETETPSEETETGETETPDASETETPDMPDSSETNTPDVPDSSETNTPDAPDPSETNKPDVPDPSETNTPNAPDPSETNKPDAPVTPDEGSDEPSPLPEQPEEANPPQEAPDTAPANEPSPEPAAPNDDLTIETTTVTIKENYAMPEDADGLKELILNDPAAAPEEQDAETVTISGISWRSEPPYDGETEGVYYFTPVLPPGYALSEGVKLPKIFVTVGENGLLTLEETEEEEDVTPKPPAGGIISQHTTWTGGMLQDVEVIINEGVELTITGELLIQKSVTFSGGGTIIRGNGEAYFNIARNSSLTLQNVTLDGCGKESVNSMINAPNRANVTLGGGTQIINCVKTAGTPGGAAILLRNQSSLTLNDARISGCVSPAQGGAICAKNSAVTINGGTYENNRTTADTSNPIHVQGGGFIHNESSTLTINGGSFLGNTASGRGGCIYHSGSDNTTTTINGGYFSGNQSPNAKGSGAIWNSSDETKKTFLYLSGAAQFAGAGSEDGTDGIYLDKQNNTPRTVFITGALVHPVRIYLEAEDDYLIAKGSSHALTRRDMTQILFSDVTPDNAGIQWQAKLNSETNEVRITSEDQNYGYFVTYDKGDANGTAPADNTEYGDNDTVTVQSADGLTLDGHFFSNWNTKKDGSGTPYKKGETFNINAPTVLYAIFEPIYTASFHSGNPQQTETLASSAENKGKIIAPALVPIEGEYTAIGWTADPSSYDVNACIPAGEEIPLTEDVSYYGLYTREIHLEFDPMGSATKFDLVQNGLIYINASNADKPKGCEFLLPTITKSGYQLLGWGDVENDALEPYAAGKPYEFDKNTKLYAFWLTNSQRQYKVEYYQQDITGDGYTRVRTDILSGAVGELVLAQQESYEGFKENTAHPESKRTGEILQNGSLVLKRYYDRVVYTADFDLNGARGTAPESQTARYGGSLAKPEEPERAGYHFNGWYKNQACTANSRWDFDVNSAVEKNTDTTFVTLYAGWRDDIAPEFGEASYNEGFTNLLNWIIRKKNLIITIPVKEEGMGVDDETVQYALEPYNGAEGNGRAAEYRPAEFLPEESVIKINVSEDFKGKVKVKCADKAGNPSEMSITKDEGGIITEDFPPKIDFWANGEELAEWYYDSVTVDVFVKDEETFNEEDRISSGIKSVSCQIDGEELSLPAASEEFASDIITAWMFNVELKGSDIDPDSDTDLGLGYGKHTISVKAVDNAGNEYSEEKELELIRQKRKYRVEHYTQDANGKTYTKEVSETETFTETIGTPVTAIPKTSYTGFYENTSHPDRIPSGFVDEEGSLVLKLYYDRNIYAAAFDLNGASGAAPNPAFALYGTPLAKPADPERTGYTFKGWYLDAAGTEGKEWDFSRSVERNTEDSFVKLYAKWADETAPLLGDVFYNKGYRRLLDYIVRKPDLLITVPITEEGSGVKQADYVLMPDNGSLKEGKAQIESKEGKTVAKFYIKKEFAGAVALSATDNAGNISAEKLLTAEDGGIIVEKTAPEITFSAKNGSLSDWFTETAKIDVSVKDVTGKRSVSSGIEDVTYQIDGKEYDVSKNIFKEEITDSVNFSVRIAKEGTHVLQVTATDHVGNKTTRKTKVKIQAAIPAIRAGSGEPEEPALPTDEPQTGDSLHVRLYATIAMIAALLYLFLFFFGAGGTQTAKEATRQRIRRLTIWSKKGGRIRKTLAAAAIFALTAHYYCIGKRADAKKNL